MTAEKFLADFCEPAASDIKMCCGGKTEMGTQGLTSALALNLHQDCWVTEITETKSC